MSSKNDRPSAEINTEILEEAKWWQTIELLQNFIKREGGNTVVIEYGFILDRDLDGLSIPPDQSIAVDDIRSIIESGISDGTIERVGVSNCYIVSDNPELRIMLCNDADIHVASSNRSLLKRLAESLTAEGTKTYWRDL